jgi:RND family efflux transporter MFP subunit
MTPKESIQEPNSAMNAPVVAVTPNSGSPNAVTDNPEKVTKPRQRALWVVLAVAVSATTIFAAAKFRRNVAGESPRDPRVIVAASAIGFQQGAPQWDQIKIERVELAKRRWSDPAPAHLRADETRTSRVGAPLPGRVGKVLATIGQRVKKGAPLFSVMSPDLATLQSERMKADVELTTAKLAYERVHSIVQAQALPAKDETIAAQQMTEAELASRTAAARLTSLKVQTLSDTEYVVKSPRDGVVVENSVLPDQEISMEPGSTSMVVADVSSVWVVADLFESDIGGIKVGVNAKVLLDASVIAAKVDNVAAASDPEQHTIAVRVTLPNPDGLLRPNTFARVQFEAVGDGNVVEVGSTALVSDGSTQYVYVQRSDGFFVRRNVVVGPVREGRALILSGLVAGEAVAERGAVLIDNQLAIYQ